MKIIAVSDIVVDWIYSPRIRNLLYDRDLAIGCGDLPHNYLDFIASILDIPVFYIHGNHSLPEEEGKFGEHDAHGLVDLHGKLVRYKDISFAGIEGSLWYKEGMYQYSQFEMWLNVFRLVPLFLNNKLLHGKYLDVFVTHAPAWGIHDQRDLPHQGIKAFRWLITNFKPTYHLHGHVHIYRPDTVTVTNIYQTRVINTYGYKKLEI